MDEVRECRSIHQQRPVGLDPTSQSVSGLEKPRCGHQIFICASRKRDGCSRECGIWTTPYLTFFLSARLFFRFLLSLAQLLLNFRCGRQRRGPRSGHCRRKPISLLSKGNQGRQPVWHDPLPFFYVRCCLFSICDFSIKVKAEPSSSS